MESKVTNVNSELPRSFMRCNYCYHQISSSVDGVLLRYCDHNKSLFKKNHKICSSFSPLCDHEDVYEHASYLYSLKPFPKHLQFELF